MANPILQMTDKYLGPRFFPRMKRLAFGLATDFWKDGTERPFRNLRSPKAAAKFAMSKKSLSARREEIRRMEEAGLGHTSLWHALPGEIAEKMFGDFYVMPGDTIISEKLITLLNLTKEMSLLDLSAGLGEHLSKITRENGIHATGLESDITIVTRATELLARAGMEKTVSIGAYDPATFKADHAYDCVIAREVFYRVSNKPAFFKEIADALKPQGQISFTDYILDFEYRDKPAIKDWQASEGNATPLGLVEMAEHWAKCGVKIDTHEDMSALYRKKVTDGLKQLAVFLGSGVRPDAETKQEILRCMNLWTHRMTAMESGMKFYHFYGSKD